VRDLVSRGSAFLPGDAVKRRSESRDDIPGQLSV